MTLDIWLLSALVILVAAITMSVAGFGFGLIVTPLLIFLLDSKTVIAYSSLFSAILCIPILWQIRHLVKPAQIAFLGISCLAGLPLGIYLIEHLNSPFLRLFITVLVILFACLLLFGFSFRLRNEKPGLIISGFIGGFLMTGAGLGGPPVVLFLINQGYTKNEFRAASTAFYLICGLASFAALGISGVVTHQTMTIAATFLPVVLLGYLAGINILKSINPVLFRKIALCIVIAAGLAGAITTVLTLL